MRRSPKPSRRFARKTMNGGGSIPAWKTGSSTSWTKKALGRNHEKTRVFTGAVLGHRRQGIRADAPRPPDVPHDDRHSADPAGVVRFRHQLGSEAPAGRGPPG